MLANHREVQVGILITGDRVRHRWCLSGVATKREQIGPGGVSSRCIVARGKDGCRQSCK